MALWSFAPPSDQVRKFETRPVLSLWTRVSFLAGSTLVQNRDLTWTQYDIAAPGTMVDPANSIFFGPSGFSGGNILGSVSSATMGFFTPLRVYLGGHTYVINDALKAELVAASTAQHPTGYGAFILALPAGAKFTGDEIMASGYTSSDPAHSAPWGRVWTTFLSSQPNWVGVAASTWRELVGQ